MSDGTEARVVPLIDAAALAARVRQLAAEIERDTDSASSVHFVVVLKGAFVFASDLMRACRGPVTCDFVTLSSYGGRDTSSGTVRMVRDLDLPLEGRDVVIVEDIIDTGLTLAHLRQAITGRRPRSLRVAALLSKSSRRRMDVVVDYVGFDIEDRFVVGYGLDLDERYRNLPFVGVLSS